MKPLQFYSQFTLATGSQHFIPMDYESMQSVWDTGRADWVVYTAQLPGVMTVNQYGYWLANNLIITAGERAPYQCDGARESWHTSEAGRQAGADWLRKYVTPRFIVPASDVFIQAAVEMSNCIDTGSYGRSAQISAQVTAWLALCAPSLHRRYREIFTSTFKNERRQSDLGNPRTS